MTSPWDEWKPVGTLSLRSKKAPLGSISTVREYTQLLCPLGCGHKVEVLSERLTKLRSVACRAHLRHCTALSEGQREQFKHSLAKSKKERKEKKKARVSRPAPPVRPVGMSTEEYIASFAFKRGAAAPTRKMPTK